MRSVVLVLASTILAMMLLASGVALAKTINGDKRDNVLVGTNRADTIHGNIGADTLRGRRGPDKLYGDPGKDTIKGYRGADRIYGGDGQDLQRGGRGNDRIITAGLQADVVNCGRGRDDFARVDPSDTVKGCERVRTLRP
jgi:Ca2+-binding RTX toxin-like protein